MDEFRCNYHDCDNFQEPDEFYCKIHEGRIVLMNDELLRPEEEDDEPDA